jgi:imidazolonepropionase-like amidohydrolase
MTQYSAEELNAAGAAARETGVWLNGHCQSPESVKLAVRAGFRSIYHCTYADEEGLDLLEAAKDEVFVSPAPGIIYANVHEGEEFGITREVATSMGSVAALEGMQAIYPEIRRRGIRALIGGDYGFPNNPTGRNARDLQLFVDLFGYTPAEALVAATRYGGQVMGMGEELGLLQAGYLADVLVVKGDPTADVTVLQDADNITYIVQNGDFYKSPATVGA